MKKFYPQLRSIQIKTGIWTVIIILLLLLGYLWLSNRLSMGSQYELKIAFTDVMGLEIGDKVMYRGMEAGRVKSISASGDRIITTAKLQSGIKLMEGSQFLIADSSLMGGKALLITPSDSAKPLDIRQVQEGRSPEGIMNVISKAAETLDDLQEAMAKLKEPGGILDKSSGLITRADGAVQNAETMARDIKQELSEAIMRVDRLTGSLNEIVSDNRGNLQRSISETPALLTKLSGTLDSLQILSGSLTANSEALNKGDGTATRLLKDDELYQKLLTSLDNLEILVKDIKANPKKYVKFSLF